MVCSFNDLHVRVPVSNEYLLAKFGFDTAENEPCEVRKFKLSEILNLNFEISKLLFAAQDAYEAENVPGQVS